MYRAPEIKKTAGGTEHEVVRITLKPDGRLDCNYANCCLRDTYVCLRDSSRKIDTPEKIKNFEEHFRCGAEFSQMGKVSEDKNGAVYEFWK
jgi:hypothetical protein